MSSQTVQMPRLSAGHRLRVYGTEAKYEFLKTLRQPAYAVPTLVFPLIFYVMFGIVLGGRQAIGSVNLSTYLLATYGVFGAMGASLFGFGVGVAIERGYGWLQVKRSSPMPPMAYLLAKTAMSMVFSSVVVIALFVLGRLFGGVHLPIAKFFELLLLLVAGSAPFCAMGLLIGCYAPPNSAPAVVNMLFLPMSFCSGLWLPLPLLPAFFQHLAPFLPPYHLGQLALAVVGFGDAGKALSHVEALAIFTAIFLLLARRGFTRDDSRVN
ncbi:MAG TPA: ABC transporter permease [Candidatus Angelobacter sp.]|nr:ABC transporter permease [Candidatus Angelobacter sp.]